MKNIENLNIDASAKENVMNWLNGQYDEETKQAIRDMMDNPNELNESFYRNLEFGTGGLRGIMGVGTNRMNKYTVAMATQGLANYVKKCFPTANPIKAAVSHDSRNHSREFAEITANVLAANGFHVYLFEALRPTPELSFAVRHLRDDPSYRAIVDARVKMPEKADTRDTEAIKRICTAYLKLLFPHVQNPEDISSSDFNRYCLKPAKEMRAIIIFQMGQIDPEHFKGKTVPDLTVKEVEE